LETGNDSQVNGYLANKDEFWLNFTEMNNLSFRTMCMPMDSSDPECTADESVVLI